jgi:hypothetical protein
MLVILSPASVNSTNVLDEVSFALETQKTIMPVLYRDCEIPFRLRRVQYVDFRSDYALALKGLLRTLNVEQMPEAAPQAPVTGPRVSAKSRFLLWSKIGTVSCGALIVASLWYWMTSSRRNEAASASQKKEIAVETPRPTASNPLSSGRQGESQSPPPNAKARRASSPPATANPSIKTPAANAARDAEAMAILGMRYEHGSGVELDYQQALSLFRKAAEAGNGKAMRELGVMYVNHWGVDQDDRQMRQAVGWYRKAIDAGDKHAMTLLGYLYEQGWGVEKDDQQAISWYRKAAAAGDASGMFHLGVRYEKGIGVEQNQQEALAWFRKAAQHGDESAKAELKWLGESPE